MSSSRDYPDEMTTGLPFDDRTAENILRGRRAAVDPGDHALIDALGAIREHATTTPQPDAALLDVFAGGIDDPAQHTASEGRGPHVGATRRRGRIRRSVRPVAVRVAALGLVAKASLAATAVAAAALGGAGAAGILPGQTEGSPPGEEPSTDVPAETEEPHDPADTGTDHPGPSQDHESPQGSTPQEEPHEPGDAPTERPDDGTAGDDALPRLPEQLPGRVSPDLDPGSSSRGDDPTGQVTDGVDDDPTEVIEDPDDLLDDPTGDVDDPTGDVDETAEDTGETIDETIDDAQETVDDTTGSIDTSDAVDPEPDGSDDGPEQEDGPEPDGDQGPLSLP